mmetsp:Transcript_13335/g.31238  ORF Transcript_13335/g.31238 Transcript_13335/m.31238 type:complete len:873 (-) Transcript_13335:215-2833(-)
MTLMVQQWLLHSLVLLLSAGGWPGVSYVSAAKEPSSAEEGPQQQHTHRQEPQHVHARGGGTFPSGAATRTEAFVAPRGIRGARAPRSRGRTVMNQFDTEPRRRGPPAWFPMEELEAEKDRALLVLVRHGQSEWNFANRFIGWYDSPLTDEGLWEAREAGRLLRDHSIEVDEVYTSMLSRTLETARIATGVLRKEGLQVPEEDAFQATWRLNERSYGALTGRNKKECTKEYGKEQLKQWRRSWDIPPPQYEDDCELYMQETEAFQAKVDLLTTQGLYNATMDPPPEQLPRGESLMCTQQRLLPFWEETLLPRLQAGKKIMVFGHENNLRALVKLLDDIDEESILEVDIPRAMPFVYMFKRGELVKDSKTTEAPRLEPVPLTPPDAAEGADLLSARYLADQSLISALHKKDILNVYDTDIEDNLEEVCIIEEEEDNVCAVLEEYRYEELLDEAAEELQNASVGADARSSSVDGVAFMRLPREGCFSRAGGHSADPAGDCGRRLANLKGTARRKTPQSGDALQGACFVLGISLIAGYAAAARRTSNRQVDGKSNPLSLGGKRRSQIKRLHLTRAQVDQYKPTAICNLPQINSDLGDALEAGATGGAEEEICELIGHDFEEQLVKQISDPFTEAEVQEAWRLSGMSNARSSAKPQAIWLLGPSAAGKSTLVPEIATSAGLEDDGYVIVDGEAFRHSHGGFQHALHEGQQRGCVFWGAYVGIRENVNDEKQKMLMAAVDGKKHLMIPSTALRLSQCVETVQMLQDVGYQINVVCLYGEKNMITSRGRRRALKTGKRYNPNEFELALGSFAPLLRLCDGWYKLYESREGEVVSTANGSGPLDEGTVHALCDKIAEAYWSMLADGAATTDAQEVSVRTW